MFPTTERTNNQSSSQNSVEKNPTQTFANYFILVYYNLLCQYFMSIDVQVKLLEGKKESENLLNRFPQLTSLKMPWNFTYWLYASTTRNNNWDIQDSIFNLISSHACNLLQKSFSGNHWVSWKNRKIKQNCTHTVNAVVECFAWYHFKRLKKQWFIYLFIFASVKRLF